MAERKNLFRNIRVIFRPGTKKLKIVLVILILVCAAALVMLGMVRGRIEAQTQSLLDQAAGLEQDNADLKEKTDQLGTSSSIKEIAREELGLVDPDTVLITPNSQ